MYLSKRKKTGVYYLYYRKEDGKRTRTSTKTKVKSEALKFLNQFELKLKSKQIPKDILLKDFASHYLKIISITHTRDSNRLTKRIITNFVNEVGNELKLKDVTQSNCENYILKTYSNSKHHANLKLRHLKSFFNKAITMEHLEKNPTRSIKIRVPENNPIYISVEELNQIISKEKDATLKFIYGFAFFTGMRLSEIINLEWEDVDLKQRELRIRNKVGFTTKNKRERVIPMTEIVYSILEKTKIISRWVFVLRERRFERSYISKKFKICVRAAMLNDKIHFHTLRHSFASSLVQKGVNLFHVQKLLGHSQISTTQRYSHLRQEDLVKAIATLD